MDITTLKKDVKQALEKGLPECLAEFAAKRQSVDDRRKEKSERRGEEFLPADWHRDGHVLFRVLVKVFGNELYFAAKAFDWEYKGPGGAKFAAQLPQKYSVAQLSGEEKKQLFEEIVGVIKPFVLQNKEDIFAQAVEVALSFEYFDNNGISDNGLSEFSEIVERENDGAWRQKLHEYAEVLMRGEKAPSVNLWNVLWTVWKYEYKEDGKEMLKFIDSMYRKVQENQLHMARECRREVVWTLDTICGWMIERGGGLSADEQALFEYTGDLKIERAEDQHAVRAGKRLKELAKESAEKTAEAEDDEKKDDSEEKEDIFREVADGNVVLKAAYYEDGREEYFDEGLTSRGWVECKILQENEAAYKTAVDFFYDIVKDGFAPRCDFEFASDVKNYTEIYDYVEKKNMWQDGHNQFWANCMLYPALKEKMRAYVKLAAEKVEYVSEEEMEEDEAIARRPDFYAAAALTLADPTGYDFAESYGAYASAASIGQSVGGVHFLASTYLNKYGVTDENAANLVRAIEQDPFRMCCEVMADYLDDGPEGKNVAAIQKLIEYSEKAGLEIEELTEKLED